MRGNLSLKQVFGFSVSTLSNFPHNSTPHSKSASMRKLAGGLSGGSNGLSRQCIKQSIKAPPLTNLLVFDMVKLHLLPLRLFGLPPGRALFPCIRLSAAVNKRLMRLGFMACPIK